MNLYTCSYNEYLPNMGLAVRTSNGTPHWFRPVEGQFPYWESVAPKPWTLKWPKDKFIQAYNAQLDHYGPDQLKAEIEQLATMFDAENLVLLCYEKLSLKGRWCHRTLLAAWLCDNLGIPVEELGAVDNQPELF
ncbi:DUF488 family protein [Rhodococcus koreensis]